MKLKVKKEVQEAVDGIFNLLPESALPAELIRMHMGTIMNHIKDINNRLEQVRSVHVVSGFEMLQMDRMGTDEFVKFITEKCIYGMAKIILDENFYTASVDDSRTMGINHKEYSFRLMILKPPEYKRDRPKGVESAPVPIVEVGGLSKGDKS